MPVALETHRLVMMTVPVALETRRLVWLVLACALAGCDDGDERDAGAGTDAGAASDAAATPDPFVDVTAAAGVVFVNRLAADRFVGGGVTWLDHDRDGDPDLFLAGDLEPAALFENRGDGTFVDATAAAGLAGVDLVLGAAAADVDGDGDADLYLLRAGADRLYINNGSGGFADGTAGAGLAVEADTGTAAAFGDYDGDGTLDLFVGNYLANDVGTLCYPDRYRGAPSHLYQGVGGGTFQEVAAAPGGVEDPTLAAAWTDPDFDGDVDLWVVNDFGPFWEPNRFWRNDGGGVFTEVSGALGLDVRIFGMSASPADADADGDLDLYATNLLANVLHLQGPGGSFVDGAATAGVAAHGFLDPGQGIPVYDDYIPATTPFDEAMATFMATYARPASGHWGATSWAAVWLDFDHDGALDLFVANGRVDADGLIPEGHDQPDMLFRGTGGGLFEPAGEGSDAWDRGEARGAAAADWDGDGDLDLAVGRIGLGGPNAGTPLLLENRVGAGGRGAISVRLEGTVSNRDGIGARVVLSAAGGAFTRIAERTGGGGFLGTGDPALHFGLGPHAAAETVDVFWPSGLHDRFGPVAAGTRLDALEGSSPAP